MSPQEFLVIAHRLALESTEAAWRTSVSRAYYAIFHVCRDRLADWGFLTRQSDQAHMAVSRRLLGSQVKPLVDLGQLLMDSKRVRNHADYELKRPFGQTEAVRFVGTIESSAATAFELTQETQRLAVDNMRSYERDVLREVTWRSPN